MPRIQVAQFHSDVQVYVVPDLMSESQQSPADHPIICRLVDDDGNDVSAYNIRGEICLRGPTEFLGYFENAEANKGSFDADGFYHTVDIGYCDSRQKLWYIVDRKKELIKVQGFHVAPAEIEAVLLDHPDIVDAAVIGVKLHENVSEVPRAYVVGRPGSRVSELTEDIVKTHVGQKLAKYKRLDGGVRIVNSIPKNASGKIFEADFERKKLRMG